MLATTGVSTNPPGWGPYASTSTTPPSILNWLHLIRSEYLEIPGLLLNRQQIQRFWNLDEMVCGQLLNALIDVRFLRRTPNGFYVRMDGSER